MIMKEAVHLPARAAQEAGIPEALLLTAGTDTVRGRQEGQAVLPTAQVQEGGARGAALHLHTVHRRGVQLTARAAATGEADIIKEEITAGEMLQISGCTALSVWWPLLP